MSGKNEEKEGGVGEGEDVEAKTNVEPDGRLVWSALDEGTTAELLSDELRADVDGQYKYDEVSVAFVAGACANAASAQHLTPCTAIQATGRRDGTFRL